MLAARSAHCAAVLPSVGAGQRTDQLLQQHRRRNLCRLCMRPWRQRFLHRDLRLPLHPHQRCPTLTTARDALVAAAECRRELPARELPARELPAREHDSKHHQHPSMHFFIPLQVCLAKWPSLCRLRATAQPRIDAQPLVNDSTPIVTLALSPAYHCPAEDRRPTACERLHAHRHTRFVACVPLPSRGSTPNRL